jgi:hypothetical protein
MSERSIIIPKSGTAHERRVTYDTGIWPARYFGALLEPLVQWAGKHPTDYHHTGFTYPDRAAFERAIASSPGPLIVNQLVTPSVTHQRRYLRQPGGGSSDTFLEHHLVGEEGNGVQGVHFDFITDDPGAMLDYVRSTLDPEALGAQIVTQSFGGGDAPVGKIGLQPIGDPSMEVGLMGRTHWSDPVHW